MKSGTHMQAYACNIIQIMFLAKQNHKHVFSAITIALCMGEKDKEPIKPIQVHY